MTQVQDLLPALIELCGLKQRRRPAYDGTSLAPLLRGNPQPELGERTLVIQRQEEKGRALVMWRKWRWVEGKLYTLAVDPVQEVDAAGENAGVAKNLAARYELWWRDRTRPRSRAVSNRNRE